MLSTLKSLNVSKSTGIDNLPAKILKLSADLIVPSLTYIFNLSLKCGEFVDEWKKARVTPIYKPGDKTKCENYRPISILPIVSKVFEKEVFRQVYSYLTDHCLLSKYQSGFRPKHSTLSALIQICDDLLNNMDQGKISCIVFLDIRKAFDSINHDILLQKMNDKFVFSCNELKWFKSYLNNREQQCFVNGQMSSPRRIICGVSCFFYCILMICLNARDVTRTLIDQFEFDLKETRRAEREYMNIHPPPPINVLVTSLLNA